MTYPLQTIVVGVGSTVEEDSVLKAAVRLAQMLRARLYAVHAFDLPPVLGYSYRIRYTYPDAYKRYRDELHDSLASQVRKLSESEQIRYQTIEGPPAEVINAVADRVDADLVLVGATRRGWVGGAILGTTAQRVIRTARTPTLVLHGPLQFPLRRVLLTTDLSAESTQACERAIVLLSALSLSEAPAMRLLRVVGRDLPFLPPHSRHRIIEAARAELEGFRAKRHRHGLAPALQARLRIGDPAQEIIAEAAEWHADLIVVGTHSRSGTARFLLGSVAEVTARGAPCNVLVIPPSTASGRRRGAATEVPPPSPERQSGSHG